MSALASERTPLLARSVSESSHESYGATPSEEIIRTRNSRRIVILAGFRMAAVFLVSCIVLGGTLWLALPPLSPDDRDDLRIPKSFAQLQALNALLKKYRHVYPYRIVICFVTVYLFLQAFSIPGSMYMSILGGAVWGVPIALPLACSCVATGATLCYLISAALGPALMTLPSWQARLQTWSIKIAEQESNLIPFMILLRLSPLPPHWVVNILCPHLGIGILPFWTSTFLGVLGVTVIHTRIGQTLDEMTSAKDFHLISWRNFFGLAAIVVGVLIPVGLRFYFRKDAIAVEQAQTEDEQLQLPQDDIDEVSLAVPGPKKVLGPQSHVVDETEDFSDGSGDEDEDLVLEGNPTLIVKDDSAPLGRTKGVSKVVLQEL